MDRPGIEPVVCVVDDDEAVRKALIRLLGAMQLRVEAYASPAEFLTRGPHEGRVVLLFDIQLPGMTGFELHQKILATGRRPPVIFITGHPDASARARAAEADAVAYLEKPFDEEHLLEALENALDRTVSDRPHSL